MLLTMTTRSTVLQPLLLQPLVAFGVQNIRIPLGTGHGQSKLC